jgi:hypothetical protein
MTTQPAETAPTTESRDVGVDAALPAELQLNKR